MRSTTWSTTTIRSTTAESDVEVSVCSVSCLLFSSCSKHPKIRSLFLFATATPIVTYFKSTNEDMPATAVVAKMGAGNFETDDNDDGLR